MNDHQNEQPRPENPPEQSKQPEDSSQSTLYQLVTGDAPPPVRIRFESTPPLRAPPRLTRTGELQPNQRVREDAISAYLKYSF